MNRNNEDNNMRKNHYADFDEHGNKRDDNNRNYNESSNSDRRSREIHRFEGSNEEQGHRFSDQEYRGDSSHRNFGARAYGDMSGGAPYGEGGSTYGGGSAYGHSNYGFSGEHGPHNERGDRNQSDHVRNGYGYYNDYDNRNYGSFGGSEYSGNMNRGSNYENGGNSRSGYGSTGRENTGYDRGFGSYGNTGYGSTGFNNRDLDRERSMSGNRDRVFRNAGNYNESGHGQDYHPRGRGNQGGSNNNYREHDMDW